MDSSSDLPTNDWTSLKDFTKEFVKRFPKISPEPDGTRIGLITFANEPTVQFNFRTLAGSQLNPTGVQQLVDKAPRGQGTKRKMEKAIKLAETDLFSPKGGARKGAKQVSIIGTTLCLIA